MKFNCNFIYLGLFNGVSKNGNKYNYFQVLETRENGGYNIHTSFCNDAKVLNSLKDLLPLEEYTFECTVGNYNGNTRLIIGGVVNG